MIINVQLLSFIHVTTYKILLCVNEIYLKNEVHHTRKNYTQIYKVTVSS